MTTVATERVFISATPLPTDSQLLDLATPIIQLLLQVKANLIPPSNEIQDRFNLLLKKMMQEGEQNRINLRHLEMAKFALVAFIDETVLTMSFPEKSQWERNPLQLQHFKENLAGLKLFEHLEDLLKNMQENITVIEIYYLCLVLGYKGKYKIYLEDQLKILIEDLTQRLQKVQRLQSSALSPHGKVRDQPSILPAPGVPKWLKISSLIAAAFVLVVYIALKLSFISTLNEAKNLLVR